MRLALVWFAVAVAACAAPRPLSDNVAQPVRRDPLSKQQVIAGMRQTMGPITVCYDRFRQQGQFAAQVRVEPDGKVSDVSWPDNPRSATTDCMAAAIRTARFAQFTGAPMTFKYPFVLR